LALDFDFTCVCVEGLVSLFAGCAVVPFVSKGLFLLSFGGGISADVIADPFASIGLVAVEVFSTLFAEGRVVDRLESEAIGTEVFSSLPT